MAPAAGWTILVIDFLPFAKSAPIVACRSLMADAPERDDEEQGRQVDEVGKRWHHLGPRTLQFWRRVTDFKSYTSEPAQPHEEGRVIVLPSMNSKTNQSTIPASHGI